MRSRVVLCAIAAVAVATTTLTLPTAAQAGAYPGNKCVGDKMKAASANCKTLLKAWSGYVGGGSSDAGKRDDALSSAAAKMTAAWSKAEEKAAAKDVDCADTTLSDSAMQSRITAAVGTIVTEVTTGLTAGDAKCGAALLKSAGDKCAALLKAEAGYIQKLAAGSDKRDAAVGKANTKFTDKVTAALGDCPSTGATLVTLGDKVDDLSEDVVTNTTVSPNLDDTQFTTISPAQYPGQAYEGTQLHPICSFGTPYHFFVKRGTVNKLVMYYQGGGACWNFLTCGLVGTFDKSVIPNGTCSGGTNAGQLCDTLVDCPDQSGGTSCNPGSDNPNHTTTGFGDLTNPNNPFKDWNIVFVSYCTGDIHFGDSNPSYNGGALGTANTRHRGWQNARTAEKFAREHFVNPEEVFVTGSSAGAYGAFFNAPAHHAVWPDSKFTVLGDAGNGIITTAFLQDEFPIWNFSAHLPTNIPGVAEAITSGAGIPAYTKAVADFFPDTAWGHYTSSYDGGTGGQTGFYNVMSNDTNNAAVAAATWPTWWNASCAWNPIMRAQAQDTVTATAATNNYRYYIGTGSRHTMYGSDKVYTDTTGGVPTIASWLTAMLNRDYTNWTNVECAPGTCGTLLPGDPQPGTLPTPPFSQVGPDVVITCP